MLVGVLLGALLFRRPGNASGASAEVLRETLATEFRGLREEQARQLRESREELSGSLLRFSEHTGQQHQALTTATENRLAQLKNQIDESARSNREELTKTLETIRTTVEKRLEALQADNTQKLEQMRQTVDEKLHHTLETRLGQSFRLVSERLEQVQKGLGEMQQLASGVGDLKKVLSNVKTRGVLGEFQLENLLEQMLTREQYERNVKTRPNSNDHVEFAIRMPGREGGTSVWLPMDAKFPIEDYQLLQAALDVASDGTAVQEAQKVFARKIESFAKTIADKYVEPPHTTDFAVLFLPFESLYAEVLRIPGLFEKLQRDYRVVVTGPTTTAALLNSLQMGFRTLAIEQRSSEVWELLGAIKTEFANFGAVLAKTQKKLTEASNVITQAETRTRVIQRKLRDVEQLSGNDASRLLEGSLDELGEPFDDGQ
ncbi:MAG: DNA recombination protein RmuC [Gammaproteobacteria bacterium]|nr:MAG: DNA recombination protein RmuC [Gammaproteobacteria bacterium]